MEKRCYVCGVVGLPKRIVSCMKCRSSFIHVYCMKVKPHQGVVPNDWACEDCFKTPKYGSSKFTDDLHAHKRQLKVIATDEAITLASPHPSMSNGIRHLPYPEKAFNLSKIPEDRAKNLQNTVPLPTSFSRSDLHFKNHRNHILEQSSYKRHRDNAYISSQVHKPSLRSCLKKSTSRSSSEMQNFKGVSFPSHFISQTSRCGTAQGGDTCKGILKASEEQGPSNDQLTVDRHLPNHPASHATWKGGFRISGVAGPVTSRYNIWGYPPAKVRRKVYEFSTKMPDVLELKVIRRCTVWANMFNGGGPHKNDIGLYFFPLNDTFEHTYSCIVSHLLNEDAVLKTRIHGTDLLIFTSSHLEENSRKINQAYYLWGLFVPPSIFSKEQQQNQYTLENRRDARKAASFAHLPVSRGKVKPEKWDEDDVACRMGPRIPPNSAGG